MVRREDRPGGDDEMHLRPTVKNEINWATMAAIFGMLMTVGGLVYNTARFTARTEGMQTRLDVMDSTLKQNVAVANQVAAKYDNLAYRVTVQEQGSQALARSIEELKQTLANQSADLRVIREILSRLDEKRP